MFFIGVFGIEEKEEIMREFRLVVCPACGAWGTARLWMRYRYFHFFFLPLVKYRRQYRVEMDCCHVRYCATEEEAQRLAQGGELDFSRLTIETEGDGLRRCPGCGAQVQRGFRFCPFCGRQL